MFTMGESQANKQSPIQMTLNSKHNKWLQFLAEEDFPPKLLCSENADLKFSVNNEGKKTSIRNRGVEKTSLSAAKATPTTRDRATG